MDILVRLKTAALSSQPYWCVAYIPETHPLLRKCKSHRILEARINLLVRNETLLST
jgi:hypothetical protein